MYEDWKPEPNLDDLLMLMEEVRIEIREAMIDFEERLMFVEDHLKLRPNKPPNEWDA